MSRWLPLAIAFFIIATIVYLADSRTIPGFFHWVDTVPYLDKLGHLTLMGALAWCVNYALHFRRTSFMLTGSLIVVILVSLEEASQYCIPARTCDWKDLLADYLGIFLAGRCIPRSEIRQSP